MQKIIKPLVFFLLIFNNINCQIVRQLVKNGDFELVETGYPNAPSQIDKAKHWHEGIFSTPDLFGPGFYFLHRDSPNGVYGEPEPPPFDPYFVLGISAIFPFDFTRNIYAGIYGIDEAIGQKLGYNISKYSLARPSIKYGYTTRNFRSGVNVCILLGNNLLYSQLNRNQFQRFGNPKTHVDFMEKNNRLGRDNNPMEYVLRAPIADKLGIWQSFRFNWSFLPTELNNSSIGIKAYDHNEIEQMYVFLDDIELEVIELCKQPCGKATEPLFLGSAPNTITPNGDGINDIWAVQTNALEYDIYVYNSNGNLVYKKENESTKVHPNTRAQIISWNATRNVNPVGQTINERLIPGGQRSVYQIIYQARNCSGESPLRQKDVTVYGVESATPVSDYEFSFAEWVCCSEEYFIENEFFESGITYRAAQRVTALNSTSPSELKVEFTGGEEVVLAPGFVAESGTDFRAWIEGCSPEIAPSSLGHTEDIEKHTKNDTLIDPVIEKYLAGEWEEYPDIESDINVPSVRVYPNPFREQLTIETNEFCRNTSVEMYDVFMRPVLASQVLPSSQREHHIQTSHLAAGTYVIVIKQNGTLLQTSRIVKQ